MFNNLLEDEVVDDEGEDTDSDLLVDSYIRVRELRSRTKRLGSFLTLFSGADDDDGEGGSEFFRLDDAFSATLLLVIAILPTLLKNFCAIIFVVF